MAIFPVLPLAVNTAILWIFTYGAYFVFRMRQFWNLAMAAFDAIILLFIILNLLGDIFLWIFNFVQMLEPLSGSIFLPRVYMLDFFSVYSVGSICFRMINIYVEVVLLHGQKVDPVCHIVWNQIFDDWKFIFEFWIWIMFRLVLIWLYNKKANITQYRS